MARRTRRRYESVGPFPSTKPSVQKIVRENTKGARLVLFRLRILYLLRQFKTITVRMLFYRLVSVYDYPNDRNFYKRLEYSLKILRKLFPETNQKFEDPTRRVSLPRVSTSKIELWLEKSSLEHFLKETAEKYQMPTLSERGFGSITMFVRAIERAKRRGVKKILLISDHDPSGLLIGEITKREMPIEVERIALIDEQIRKYNLPSISVKRTDSRSKKYLKIYGNRAWEVEAIPPKALLRIVGQKIKENLTPSELEELNAEKIAEAAIEPLVSELIEELRRQATQLAKGGNLEGGHFGYVEKTISRVLPSLTFSYWQAFLLRDGRSKRVRLSMPEIGGCIPGYCCFRL